MEKTEWIHCPVCGAKTRDRMWEDTVIKNYPLYCPKYKRETLIDRSKEFTSNRHQRARHTDAEPMNL